MDLENSSINSESDCQGSEDSHSLAEEEEKEKFYQIMEKAHYLVRETKSSIRRFVSNEKLLSKLDEILSNNSTNADTDSIFKQ